MMGPNLSCPFSALIFFAVAGAGPVCAQVQTEVPPAVPGARPVKVEHIKVHSPAIAGNLEGESADRDIIVFLPPSYNRDKHHGTHTSAVADRFQNHVLPFFSQNLCATQNCR